MAKQLFANNASSYLAASIDDNDLTIQVSSGQGALFPNPGAGEYFLVTLMNADGDVEIVKIESRSSDLLTVASGGRGQEGTEAQAWVNGQAIVECRITQDTLDRFLQTQDDVVENNLEFSGDVTFSGGTTGVDADELGGQLPAFYRDAGNLNAGTIPAARVGASSVTQHQAALAIATSQLTGDMPDARIVSSNVTQHQTDITAVNASATVNGETIGYRGVPRTTGGLENGKMFEATGTVTLNTSDMAEDYCFSILNRTDAAIALTQGSGVSLYKAGEAGTGSRTIPPRGVVTIWCQSGTEAYCMGVE